MKFFCLRLIAMLMLFALGLTAIQAQTTGAIAGTVRDQSGAFVPNATVVIRSDTGQEFTTTTDDNGTYRVPAVASGTYVVTITSANFKKVVIENVKVDVGLPTTVDAALEAGNIAETVTVTSGGEVLQTQTATIATTIQGRQILETPIQSRDALDLVTLLPGTNTVGTVRTSSVNGLPKGTLSITIDGVDVQDNFLRSSDGFFTYVRPRIDAIDEVTVSTASPGAESSGDGAVQIKFVTRRGTNDYTGGLYWQHRDEGLNANYFFNNRDGIPRNKIRLNQYGGRFGGPIPFLGFGEGVPIFDSGKNKRFFFVNYEEYRIPEASPTRVRTILSPEAQNGIFRYGTTSINLFQLAAQNNLPSTPDPLIASLLTRIRQSTTTTGSITPISGTVNRQNFNFVNTGNQLRRFLAARVDFNLTKDHSLENVLNYQPFRSTADFLNSLDPAFPGFANAGAQNSDRWSNSIALRSNFGSNIVNEARYSRLWGESGFSLVGGDQFFTEIQGGYNLAINATNLGISSATARNAASIRTSPTYDFTDTLTWIRGSHTFTFGGQYKLIKTISDDRNQIAPTVNFGILTTDPANAVFAPANFPGATTAQIAEAAALYAVLTGRVSSYTQTAYLGANGQYVASGPLSREVHQRTFGLYAQDTWRIRPNLTLTFGVRWQPQEGYKLMTENYSKLVDFNMLYDVSGAGNLFSPGTLTGQVPQVIGTRKGEAAYPTDWFNFAPSIGVVYSPNFKGGMLRRFLGEGGKSVFRAGFSRSFVREGTLLANNTLGINPGGTLSVSRSTALQNFTVGTLLRDPNNPNLRPAPFAPTPNFPRALTAADTALAFDPDLKTGYVDSWSVGYQRELDRNTVIEFRYVGNRGKDMLRLYSLNELNVRENGFAGEFRLAQANLLANRAAGRGNTFAYAGPGTGTSPLPILFSYMVGAGDPTNPALYNANFSNATLYNNLTPNNPNVLNLASLIENNFRATGTSPTGGRRPVNFFNNCPTTLGFCFIVDNSELSWYDAGVVELRRRLSNGLRVQASYTYAKAFTNSYAGPTSFGAIGVADQNNNASVTLRNPDLDKSESQVDLRHAFKLDATYDLPFGRGQRFFSNSNWITNALIGGFSIVPTLRWQSGSPVLLENVQLVGMTRKDLQKAVGVYKTTVVQLPGTAPQQVVTYLPADIIENTIRAFNPNVTTANGYSAFGAPSGRFIAPAGYGNCVSTYPGECGFRKLVLFGPSFFKLDTAVFKRIQIDEKRNVELRVTAFDILNKTNFRIGGWTANVSNVANFGATTFGQLGSGTAYQDPFGSNDPGGRVVDLTLRINF